MLQKVGCGDWTQYVTRCAGRCDTASGRCVCGPRAKYPERPLAFCEWRGVDAVMLWANPGWAHYRIHKPWQARPDHHPHDATSRP